MKTLTHSFSIYSDGTIVRKQISQFAFVKHCFQSEATGYRAYWKWRDYRTPVSLPSVFQLYSIANQQPVWTTEKLQRWMYEECIVKPSEGTMNDTQMKAAWYNLVMDRKAFTNKAGDQKQKKDWILDKNLQTNNTGFGVIPVIATGATIKLKGEPYRVGDPLSDGFIWLQPFEIFDANKPDTVSITWGEQWWKWMPATNSVGYLPNNERINPFPKMNGDRDTLWPFLGNNDTGLIDTRWLKYLDYVPEKPLYPYLPFRNRGGTERWLYPIQ